MQKITSFPKPTTVGKRWILVDADNVVLGKLATAVADLLRGKGKTAFSEHLNTGDHVIVINAEKIALTGNKLTDKIYRRHSGYLGSMKEVPADKVLDKQPTRLVKEAVYGMLPKNRLRKHFMANLYIYKGPEHKHAGQNPETVSVK